MLQKHSYCVIYSIHKERVIEIEMKPRFDSYVEILGYEVELKKIKFIIKMMLNQPLIMVKKKK